MDALTKFLLSASVRTFRLSDFDCGLWLADWYMTATGKPDPAAHLRGKAYVQSDLIRHVRSIVRSLHLARTSNPVRGDVGIARLGDLAIGAIFTGKRWAMIGERGLSATSHPHIIAAWRVE